MFRQPYLHKYTVTSSTSLSESAIHKKLNFMTENLEDLFKDFSYIELNELIKKCEIIINDCPKILENSSNDNTWHLTAYGIQKPFISLKIALESVIGKVLTYNPQSHSLENVRLFNLSGVELGMELSLDLVQN